MGQNIYQIGREFEEIFDELEENGGELTEELEKRLAVNQENLKTKLDSYRKVYSSINSEVDVCKAEETRIAKIRKIKQNVANRLKSIMLDAVINYGDEGKSGNRSVSLVDSKLYTRASKCCEINTSGVDILIGLFFKYYRNAYNNDCLKTPYVSLDPEYILNWINEMFEENYYDTAKELKDTTGHLFTIDDLYNLDIKIESRYNLGELIRHIDVINSYFNNETNANIIQDLDKTTMKGIIIGGHDITIASLCDNVSLIIK